MGLSLSVLIALVLLLPGAAFVFAVTRLHSPTAPSTGLEQQLSLSLAVALIASIAAHIAGLALLQLGACVLAGLHKPNLVAIIQLLGGQSTGDAALAPKAIGEHPFCIGAYISFLTAVMWFVGKQANSILKSREQADWYGLLRPEGVGLVVLTADFVMGGQTILYKGVVKEFRIAKTGDLERVVLGIAARKPWAVASLPPTERDPDTGRAHQSSVADGDQDESGSPQSLGHGWIEIPGEAVVLQMKDAKTVNLDYFWTSGTADDVNSAEDQGKLPLPILIKPE